MLDLNDNSDDDSEDDLDNGDNVSGRRWLRRKLYDCKGRLRYDCRLFHHCFYYRYCQYNPLNNHLLLVLQEHGANLHKLLLWIFFTICHRCFFPDTTAAWGNTANAIRFLFYSFGFCKNMRTITWNIL